MESQGVQARNFELVNLQLVPYSSIWKFDNAIVSSSQFNSIFVKMRPLLLKFDKNNLFSPYSMDKFSGKAAKKYRWAHQRQFLDNLFIIVTSH